MSKISRIVSIIIILIIAALVTRCQYLLQTADVIKDTTGLVLYNQAEAFKEPDIDKSTCISLELENMTSNGMKDWDIKYNEWLESSNEVYLFQIHRNGKLIAWMNPDCVMHIAEGISSEDVAKVFYICFAHYGGIKREILGMMIKQGV